MDVVVSPYHLTTREPAVMAALLLAEQVVTLMPAPMRTMRADDLRDAATALPRYRKFVESWKWTEALWASSAIVAEGCGEDPLGEVRRVWDDLLGGRWSELAPLMRAGLFDDDKEYLDAVAGDVLKGGPDPGISVPLHAGLDRFAVRHGMMVARSAATSVAQKAEEGLGRRIFAFSIPVLLQASGELMSDVRADAEEMLAPMRGLFGEVAAVVAEGDQGSIERESHALGVLGKDIAKSAMEVEPELSDLMESAVAGADIHDTRAVGGLATVVGVVLPVDAVLRSSARAARAMIGEVYRGEKIEGASSPLPVMADPLVGGRFVGLVVKEVGRERGRWR